MNLSKIHHIAIIVSNYESAKDFYVNKLGFSVIRENYRPERKDWKLDLRVDEHTELEIFAEPNPPKRVSRPEACGLRHLAFCVESVEQTVKELAEENTPAAEMADQVPEEVKEERRDELMELQQEISYDRGQDRIGQELLVMIEGKVADESAYIGRTYGDAPKVDGYIFVQTGELLMTGDFAKVRVTGALEYDLIGVLSDEYTE